MQDLETSNHHQSHKGLYLLMGAGILLLLGAGFVFFMRTQQAVPPAPMPQPVGIAPISDIPAPLKPPEKEMPPARVGKDTGELPTKPPTAVPPVAMGTIDPKAVAKFIDERFVLIKSCYERRLRHNPLLEGKIDVNIGIAPGGTVTSVKKSTDSIQDAEMWGCMKKTIRKWKFPKPQGGPVEIAKLFSFKKTD